MLIKRRTNQTPRLKTAINKYRARVKSLKLKLLDAARNYKLAVEQERIIQADKRALRQAKKLRI